MPASQPEGTEQRVRIDPASKGPAPLRVSVVSALGGHPYSGDIWLAAREFTQWGVCMTTCTNSTREHTPSLRKAWRK